MPIGNKQIGWSNESNLLWDISNQLDRLTKVIAANTGGGGGTNPTSTFMPFNNAGTFADSFLVNDTANSVLKSVYSGNDIGLKLDFSSKQYLLGDFNYDYNGTHLFIADTAQKILTVNNNNYRGLNLDFGNLQYWLGDYSGNTNNYWLMIDDLNGVLYLNGANLEDSTSSGSSGQHLVIVLNGNTYKIKLENP